MFKLSVVVTNYNYEHFISDAIDSALAVEWPDVEVIVVDDGSTDGSRRAIEAYGARVIAVFQANQTQRVAYNAGYARSTGEVVIFLDSDDMLKPSVATEIAKVWHPGVSKVQLQMARVDEAGRSMGSVFPAYEPLPTPELIRQWVRETASYPTPPGSGNAYSRAFLEQIFPIGDQCGTFGDSACIAAAPLFGDVATVPSPLVLYRIHSRNDSNARQNDRVFSREVNRAMLRYRYQQELGKQTGVVLPDENLFKSLHLLLHRAASLRLTPSLHPLTGDGRGRALRDTLGTLKGYSAMSLKRRAILGVWLFLTLTVPLPFARKLIALKFGR